MQRNAYILAALLGAHRNIARRFNGSHQYKCISVLNCSFVKSCAQFSFARSGDVWKAHRLQNKKDVYIQ